MRNRVFFFLAGFAMLLCSSQAIANEAPSDDPKVISEMYQTIRWYKEDLKEVHRLIHKYDIDDPYQLEKVDQHNFVVDRYEKEFSEAMVVPLLSKWPSFEPIQIYHDSHILSQAYEENQDLFNRVEQYWDDLRCYYGSCFWYGPMSKKLAVLIESYVKKTYDTAQKYNKQFPPDDQRALVSLNELLKQVQAYIPKAEWWNPTDTLDRFQEVYTLYLKSLEDVKKTTYSSKVLPNLDLGMHSVVSLRHAYRNRPPRSFGVPIPGW